MLYETYKITKPVRLIEFFAGIGSQAKALERMGIDFQHWKICEWAIPSIMAYKEIHSKYLSNDADHSKELTKDELIEYLYKKGVSSNYNNPMKLDQIKRLNEKKLRQIYNAIITENNLVNIQQVRATDLEIKETNKYDYILTYSFPCQDLSLAGKQKGMSRDGGTRSGMLWEVERILKECNELPQILLMENVPQVIGANAIDDFQEWEYELEKLGYKNYVEVLNAKDYGIPQNRQRCFMISILGDYNYTFPRTIPLNIKLKDMLEDNVDEKYYFNSAHFKSLKERVKIAACYKDDTEKIINNNYKSDFEVMDCRYDEGIRIRKDKICPTICTRSGLVKGLSGATIVLIKNKLRFLTGKESYRIMGFNDEDCDNARKVISENMIYHTAGDSIVVNVLEAIFKQLF